MTEHMVRTDEELEEMDAEPECTGLTASWCPRCGDCNCLQTRGSMLSLDDPDCPLHATDSLHAAGR